MIDTAGNEMKEQPCYGCGLTRCTCHDEDNQPITRVSRVLVQKQFPKGVLTVMSTDLWVCPECLESCRFGDEHYHYYTPTQPTKVKEKDKE